MSSQSPTYAALAALRSALAATKQKERRAASEELLDLLSDSSTLKKLAREAQRGFDDAARRGSRGGRGGEATFPEERVDVLFRSLLDASILAASKSISGEGGRQRKQANGTGYIKQSCKFTAEDVLFPQKVFLRIEPGLEYCDGGYAGSNGGAGEGDWKTRPRYGFRLDASRSNAGSFGAAHYPSPPSSSGTRLSAKEILASVNYCISCLNDDDCLSLAEAELMQWLAHICARPDYVAVLGARTEASFVLHEASERIYGGFGERGERPAGSFAGFHSSGNGSRRRREIRQECLLASAKCLCGLIYNCTTRLGVGMQLYLRPTLEMVAWWAENAWVVQTGGPSSAHRTTARTESDVAALLPYLYSSATHLLAAHPEQSVPVLSERGRSLLRLAKKNYLKSAANPQTRDALTEYLGAHVLVAETSGKLYGLPEGDLGPLAELAEDDDQLAKENPKVPSSGATLDRKAIDSLLEIVRNEKVWESLFSSAGGEQDALAKKNKSMHRRKTQSRRMQSGNKRAIIADGGGRWTPLNRKQRRYLELVSRLLRLSQRLHLAEAEALGDGSADSWESLVDEALRMTQKGSAVENGEIDVDTGINSTSSSDADLKHVATAEALAGTPWVKMVCQHLYKLNPKLEMSASLVKDGSMTQSSLFATSSGDEKRDSFTQNQFSATAIRNREKNGQMSHEQCLLQSCPILRALVCKEPTATADSIRPTTTATLQVICASAESFPRGECWASSTRRYWTTTLDETAYPGGASARVRERNGSSPADAASVVYLLGTTLESCGSSGGDDDVQVWTLMALLKMAESSAIICTREGLHNMSFEALRVAWQYVWRTLFRYDLRYSSYTSGAYAGNAGELVLQLLTQIVRYQCTDRMSLPLGNSRPSDCSPFIQEQSKDIWRLPCFEKAVSVLSGTCFELVTAVIQHANVADNGEVPMDALMELSDATNASVTRDRKWLISFCMRFIEHSLTEDKAQSMVQRSFLPFVATCLASLVSDGGIVEGASTFELSNLTTYSTTEDTEPVCIGKGPEQDALNCDAPINRICDILWKKSLLPYIHPGEGSRLLGQRFLQDRGALLVRYSDAVYERQRLCALRSKNIESSPFAHKRVLGDAVFDKVKTIFDELLFGLRYGSDGEDESAEEEMTSKRKKASETPHITGCLSLLLTIVLSSHDTVDDAAKQILDIAATTIIRVLDYLPDIIKMFILEPPDLLAIINHLDGITRVLTHVAAASSGTSTSFPTLFKDHFKDIYAMCKGILRNHRHSMYASNLSPLETSISEQRRMPDYDSDDDGHAMSQMATQQYTQSSQFSDDSDGFMDDAADSGPSRRMVRPPPKRSAPPPKRRRMENTSIPVTHKQSVDISKAIDQQGAWATSSLMIVLKPSIESLELISGHLVWPEDYDSENGYSPVSKSIDPSGALVCASLFCQKSVIQRQHFLSLQQSNSLTDEDDQQSAIVLCVEVILQARRHATPASKYFMWGLGILFDLIELGDRNESHFSLGATESKLIIDTLYPEGASQDNEDYRLIRQLKKVLKFRSLYRADQLCTSTLLFLRGQDNIHKSLDDIFVDYFIKSSFRHIDEDIRAHACDALGVALGGFAEQKMIVSEMFRSILPPLKSEKKFKRWTDSLTDPKMPVDLSQLEQSALNDARLSFEFHAIDCIGLIAGSTTDEDVCVDMVWKLIDLNAYEPAMGLLSRRACERAALMLGFKKVDDLFSDMAPHLLVKWIESRRSLREFPLLLSSPFALQGVCRYLPNEVLDMLMTEGGWDDKLWNFESLTTTFTQSSADFLVPIILLTEEPDRASEEEKDDVIDSSQLLSELILILMESTSDETFAKILRHHISDIFGYVLVLQSDTENAGVQSACDLAFKHLTGRISEAHIERDGAKQSFMILRRILKLNAVGVSVVNQDVHLTSTSFVEGMKRVSQHINKQSKCGFLESVGSSLTELFIFSGFWLSCNGNSVRQREKFFKPIILLSNILQDLLREATIKPQELGFCFNFFISSSLDPRNHLICPDLLESLKDSLHILFHQTKDISLVDKVLPAIHKLCLALLAIHKRSFLHFLDKCNMSLASIEYTKKCSLGLLAKSREIDGSWEDASYLHRDNMLKELIKSKASLEEKTSSEIMIGAYDCLDVIVNSGKVSLDDILGAEDIVTHEATRRHVFGDVNEKYEVDSLFNAIQRTEQRSLLDECHHFIQIMDQYPIADDTSFHSHSQLPDVLSVDALARLLALQRLEKSITAQNSTGSDALDIPHGVLDNLIGVCQSREDSNEAKVISSRCLGELSTCWTSISSAFSESTCQNTSVDDPLQSMQIRALSMVGQFILSGTPEVSLIAMKTAKSLLSLADGKECWNSLDGEQIKGVLNPFVAMNGTLHKEQLVLSSNYIDNLKMIGGSKEVDNASWCWNEDLWTCFAYNEGGSDGSYWIKNVVSAMISCCFCKASKNAKSNFIRACLGLCAKEASFSSCLFPGIIFFLLDAEDRIQYERSKNSTRDLVLSETAIGSPASQMNIFITQCFSRILGTSSKDFVAAPYAVRVVLDTLDMLHSVTKNRFLSSSFHVKNSSDLPKQYSSTNKKSRKSSAAAEADDLPLPPKWQGVPYGVVLGLDGLEVAMACMKSKKYYSAIYYCEMAMQNFSGVGNFLEQIANDSIPNMIDTSVGDISGFGVEREQKRSLLDLALLAKDILVGCLSELQHKEELHGVLSQASALSLKQNIMTMEPVQECHNDQALPMLLDLDVELQSRGDSLATDASIDVARVATCLEDLGLEHVKQHYIKGVGSTKNEQFREKWFEDALFKASQWDNTLLPQSDNALHSLLSSESVVSPTQASTNVMPSLLMTPNYYESVYQSLQSFVRQDTAGGLVSITQARQMVLRDIGLLEGSESTPRSMSDHISKLNVLSSLSVLGETLDGKVTLQNVLKHWGFVDESGIKDFKSLLLSFDEASLDIREQPVTVDGAIFRSLRLDLSTKEVLLKILLRQFPQDRDTISQAIASHIYSSCRIYRDIGRPDAARQTLSRMRTLLQVVQSPDMPIQSAIPLLLRLEDAKVMARQLDFDNAITHCKTLVNHLSNARNLDEDFTSVLVRALLLGGCLMAHEHVDAVGAMESFFDRAATLSHRAHEKGSHSSSLIHATTSYFKLGEFAAGIYSSVDARVSSEAWKQRKANQIEREKELASLQAEYAQLEKKYKRSKKQVDMDTLNAAHIKLSTLSKEVDLDGREIRNTQDSLQKYLGMAIVSYCNALKLCPATATSIDYSKHVFKLIGLWFENCQKSDTHSIVNNLLQSNASHIPTYHFVPLIYQIFSRIDENDASGCFQATLRELVVNICAEHPYHGIPQLIALSNSNLTNKLEAAKSIFQQLRKHAPAYVSGLIDSYECLMNSYIDLAMLDTSPIPKKQTKGFTFSKYKLKLDVCLSGGRRGPKNLSLTNAPAIISKPPSIRPDGQYGNGSEDPIGTERVVGFESTFELAPSGLHRPAIVICLGSQGGRFKQLVKGDDDMRQDAVMQQVFGTMNNLLKNEDIRGADHKTKTLTRNSHQQLKIITYGITPLSPNTGVLEWVDNTDSFGSFMTGNSNNVGAPSRYYPGEWGNSACNKLYFTDHEHKSQEERRRDFDIVCRNISPVFRFFFVENFSSSMEAWHTARTAYTRSCAVNSIVGHILGIGDRHTSNILVHTKTGELVHIDFGYVFEQAKLLRTPEMVPFRLTRNVIDGMGPCGTDGVFSKSAEATLSVLRKNSDTVLTILSAIVSDPLYRWISSPSTPDDTTNEAAQRVMAKVHDKLQGFEVGTSGLHTVAGQVKFLINEARDPNNLCNMYSGWQPWI